MPGPAVRYGARPPRTTPAASPWRASASGARAPLPLPDQPAGSNARASWSQPALKQQTRQPPGPPTSGQQQRSVRACTIQRRPRRRSSKSAPAAWMPHPPSSPRIAAGRRAFSRTVPVTRRHTADRHHPEADLRSSHGWTCWSWRAICGMDARAARLRCQRRTVPGVTSRCIRSFAGRSRMSAARIARPAQSSRGRGLARRSTAPRAAARATRRLWRAMNGRAGPASRRAGRRRGKAGAGTRMIIMPYGWPWPIAAAHRPSRLLAPRRRGSLGASRPRESDPGNSRDLSFVVLTNY
jgi:hypothetical protein